MDRDTDDTSMSTTKIPDQVMGGDASPTNAGNSTGGESSTSNNVDESALQNLNVSGRCSKLKESGSDHSTSRSILGVNVTLRLEI